MTRARARSARSGRTEHVYGETRYAAGSWKQQRRVVIKAEVVRLAGREPRDNPRFVVTNLCRPPRSLYEKVYCARGDIENRIKELLDGLQIDRTSCCRFAANQLRVLLTTRVIRPRPTATDRPTGGAVAAGPSSTRRRLRRTAPSCRARGRRARQRRSRVPHVHLSPTPATFQRA